LVVGLGIFGFEAAVQLAKNKMNVIAVDKNTRIINNIKDFVQDALVADASDEDVIKELSVDKYDFIIVGLSSNFEALILCVTHLKKMGQK